MEELVGSEEDGGAGQVGGEKSGGVEWTEAREDWAADG